MEENYEPIVDRVGKTLARVVYDPIKCGLTRENWVELHARLYRESGGATYLNLDDASRGVVSINWNAAKNDEINLEQAIDIIAKAIKDSKGLYDAVLKTPTLQSNPD